MLNLCEIYEECDAVEISEPFENRILCGAGIERLNDSEVFDEVFEIFTVVKWKPEMTGWPMWGEKNASRSADFGVLDGCWN